MLAPWSTHPWILCFCCCSEKSFPEQMLLLQPRPTFSKVALPLPSHPHIGNKCLGPIFGSYAVKTTRNFSFSSHLSPLLKLSWTHKFCAFLLVVGCFLNAYWDYNKCLPCIMGLELLPLLFYVFSTFSPSFLCFLKYGILKYII